MSLHLRSVRSRLLLVAIVIEAIMLTLLVSNSLRLLTTHMGMQARNHAEQIAPVLLAAIVAPIGQRDYATVQAVLDESRAVEGIEYLVITDNSGRRLVSSGWPADQALPEARGDALRWANFPSQARYDVAIPVVAYGQPLGKLHFGLDLSQIIAAHDELFRQGVLIALTEIILSAGLMALLGYFLTRHLATLTKAAEAVAEGNLTPPPVPEGNDDVGRLGAAFNAMSHAVSERIVELTQAHDEARQLAAQAEAGARAKSAFLATMSHEIRTPLNGILGMTELTLGTSLTSEQREYLNWVRVSGESLLHILNDILDFSKIDAGQMHLEQTAFNLPEMLDSLVGLHRAEAAKKDLDLGWHADTAIPEQVVGDPIRLRQIFDNLLTNALKFTASGRIDILVRQEPAPATDIARLHFAVVDTGIGIAPDKLDLIFAPFTQAEAFTTRQYGGTGLGLSIVLRLVELMGGAVTVKSEPGKGSTFELSLDLALAHSATTAQEAPALQNQPPVGEQLRVLLVEDTPVNQLVAQRMLVKHGFAVDLAKDGEEALLLLAQQAYDVVLMDVQMPRMDGLQATRLLRQHEMATGRVRTPVIALTANALPADRKQCLEAGMDDFIAKPFRQDDMLAAIRRHT